MWLIVVGGCIAVAWSLPAKGLSVFAAGGRQMRAHDPAEDVMFMFQKDSRLARAPLALSESEYAAGMELEEFSDAELLAEASSVHSVSASLLEAEANVENSVRRPVERWMERAQEHMRKVVFGLLVLVIANALLLVIERRRAAAASLLARGRSDCVEALSEFADADNRGRLVHLAGDVRAVAPLADSRFPAVCFEDGCVRLRSVVEVYRWVETNAKEDQMLGGDGRPGTTTTYEYTTQWSETFEDSAMFHHRKGHENICPKEVQFGTITADCARAEVGAYQLPRRMVESMEEQFEGMEAHLPHTLTTAGRAFVREDHGPYYYWRHGGVRERETEDQIGDCRVKFTYMSEGSVSVVALQCHKNNCETFVPYRLMPQMAGSLAAAGGDEERRSALLAEGEKSQSVVAEEWRWLGGRLWWLCGISNLFACADSKASLGKEIFYLTQRRFGQASCMSEMSMDMSGGSWSNNTRIGCWISMIFAIALSSFPFVTCMDSMPLIKASGDLASCVVIVVLFLTCTLTTVALAYVDLDAPFAGALMGAVVSILVLPQLIAMPFVH